MTPILEVANLTKQFGSFRAVDDISFMVGEGEIVGLLGPNGAGKTTTIQMLLDLITADAGMISYFGKPFGMNKEYCLSRMNYASAYSQVQGKLTVAENMKIFAGLYNVPDPKKRIIDLLELLEISELANSLFWKISAGQKTRVIIAKALLNKPRLILMDEPTASLDPDIAAKVLKVIRELQRNEGISLLYTSHNMKEVEELCDRVIFLDNGKIVAEDTPFGLTKRVKNSKLQITYEGTKEKMVECLNKKKLSFSFPREHVVEVSLLDSQIPTVLFHLGGEGIQLTEIDIEKPDLSDVFMAIAKGKYES